MRDDELSPERWVETAAQLAEAQSLADEQRRPPGNQDYWERLIEAVALHEEVAFTWLPAHAGHEFNERAHQLAYAPRLLAEKLYGAEDETANA